MKYSAIIVLGHHMDINGVLNDESSARMDVAIEAFRNQEAPVIITCGWAYREDSSLPIANAMKSYALGTGHVPQESIITEINSRDTVGDAIFSKVNIFCKNNWNRFLVVTSDYHEKRTLEIFSFIYGEDYHFEVRPARTDKKETLAKDEQDSTEIFRKTFSNITRGDDPAIFERLCQQHPFYNGHVYPKISME